MDTGSPSRADLSAALHRLRSTLARVRAELELAEADSTTPQVRVLLEDMREALELLGNVESAALDLVRVLVIDDDARLGELMARGLRRLGYDAEASARVRTLRSREIVVLDLGVVPALSAEQRALVAAARPIVVTGAVDAPSRALAAELCAADYLVKPVEIEVLAEAISRRRMEERQ